MSLDFYSTAATVIPILFIALLVEGRAFPPEKYRSDQIVAMVIVVVELGVFVVGEFAAFRVLDTGHPTSSLRTAVVAGLAVPSAWLVLRVLVDQFLIIGGVADRVARKIPLVFISMVLILVIVLIVHSKS